MHKAVLLTIALLSAEDNPDATSTTTVSVMYSTICREYDQAIANARQKHEAQGELRRISETRQEAFLALIASGLSKPEKMVAADWAAISMASEHLFQRDECIKYSFRAIELDPRTKEAYPPLIRSLLNCNRINDAEAALASAEMQFNDGTKWHGLHYILFVKHRDQKNWIKAATHLQTVLDTMLLDTGENTVETRRAAKYLSEYLNSTQHAGWEEHGRHRLQTWFCTCADTLERRFCDDGAGAKELLYCAALCEVQCEIAKCLPEIIYDDYLLQWAKVVYDPRWASYENVCRSQQLYFGKYVETNAVNVKNWSNVAAGLSQLLKDHIAVVSAEQSMFSKLILIKLKAFAESRIANDPAGELNSKR